MAALAWFVAAAISTFAALCQYFGLGERAGAVGQHDRGRRSLRQSAPAQPVRLAHRHRDGCAAVLAAPRASAAGTRWPRWRGSRWAMPSRRPGPGCCRCCLLGLLACALAGPAAGNGRGSGWSGCSPTRWLPWLCPGCWRPSPASARTTCGTAWRQWTHAAAARCCGPTSLHLIGQKPWLGWGWGELDFAHYATLVRRARGSATSWTTRTTCRCTWRWNWASRPRCWSAAACCGPSLAPGPGREADPVRQMAWAVLAVIGVHSLLEYPLWYGPVPDRVRLVPGPVVAGRIATRLTPAREPVARSLAGRPRLAAGVAAAAPMPPGTTTASARSTCRRKSAPPGYARRSACRRSASPGCSATRPASPN